MGCPQRGDSLRAHSVRVPFDRTDAATVASALWLRNLQRVACAVATDEGGSMGDMARQEGRSGQLERRGIPEVAALGNVLTQLFNTLGITQSAYAHRVHLDKSAISRYLSGSRLPSQDFIDRLVRDVEEQAGTPLQDEAKESLRQQRLTALAVTNPAEHELELLRIDLSRARRDAQRAQRQVDGLHLLLEQKQREKYEQAAELIEMRRDWAADASRSHHELLKERDSFASYADELTGQVAELKRELAEAIHLRELAEHRSIALQEDVLELEQKLATELPQAVASEVPLDHFIQQVAEMLSSREGFKVSKELADSAWSRSANEVVELLVWLSEHYWARARDYASDIARFRVVGDVISIGVAASERRIDEALLRQLSSVLSAHITVENVNEACHGWREIPVKKAYGEQTVMADILIGNALNLRGSDIDTFLPLILAIEEGNRFSPTATVANFLFRPVEWLDQDRWVSMVLDIIRSGWRDLASAVVLAFCQNTLRSDLPWFSKGLASLHPDELWKLMKFASNPTSRAVNRKIKTHPVEPVCIHFAERLWDECSESRDMSLLDHFLRVCAETGSLDVIRSAPHYGPMLARYIDRRVPDVLF